MEPKPRQTDGSERVLWVDDEPMLLEAIGALLRRRFDLVTATSAAEGLSLISKEGPPAVVLSDLIMPIMDGAAFLSRVREIAPETVRMLFTGVTDIDAAVTAVNEGQIFRFLTKPCDPAILGSSLDAALAQHRLITAERVLLERTLKGSLQTLADLLALAHPVAFARAVLVRQHAIDLTRCLEIRDAWHIEIAALFSQVGCVTLPATTVEKVFHGEPLRVDEQAMVDRLPLLAEQLLAHIPRLDAVRESLVNQGKRFDGTGPPSNGLRGERIPLGARILKLVLDYETLEGQGVPAALAIDTMRGRAGWYDPVLLEAFARLRGHLARTAAVEELPARDVQVGMVLAEDLKTKQGILIAPRGYEVTWSLVERLRNYSPGTVCEPVGVVVRRLAEEDVNPGEPLQRAG